ncbi:hypothetical protein EVAR_21925_1 [Eumeta japonica]|uniref:Uncharacterized protein n=1 Tax=Eumeta variegata TaxID=151549 RepID=A0A4C1XHA2_EUMVA|nr:hypothetical protein EVAR_21925_1 [Eumeta japonica]
MKKGCGLVAVASGVARVAPGPRAGVRRLAGPGVGSILRPRPPPARPAAPAPDHRGPLPTISICDILGSVDSNTSRDLGDRDARPGAWGRCELYACETTC